MLRFYGGAECSHAQGCAQEQHLGETPQLGKAHCKTRKYMGTTHESNTHPRLLPSCSLPGFVVPGLSVQPLVCSTTTARIFAARPLICPAKLIGAAARGHHIVSSDLEFRQGVQPCSGLEQSEDQPP